MTSPQVPEADPILTPAQFGAVAPKGDVWPLNREAPDTYALNRIYPTVQGEGGQTGTPMTIVRLQGCPVGCVFCDTPDSWAEMPPTLTAAQVAQEVYATQLHWALVTGGEPTWHHLTSLTRALHARGIRAALETAGTYPVTGLWDWVTLSPKPQGLRPLDPDWLRVACEVKWVVGKPDDVVALDHFLDQWGPPLKGPARVSVQPLSASAKATRVCLDALMAHPHWFLSLQTHKMIAIA